MTFRSRFHAQTLNQLYKIGVMQVAHVVNNVLHIVPTPSEILGSNFVNIIMHVTRDRRVEKISTSLTTLHPHR